MFKTEIYHIRSEKIKTPVKLVMLADLHNHLYGEHNQILLEAVRKEAPELVCIAGDLLIGHSKVPYTAAQELCVSLSKEFPVFYGLGNHEARMRRNAEGVYGSRYEDYMAPIVEAGARVLVDECEEVFFGENQLKISGYDLPMKYFEKFNRYLFESSQIETALGACDREKYNILLAHNPVYFRQYAAWGADLTLSGHLHGGIIRLPLLGGVITPQAKLFPRYSAGEYTFQEKKLIVSRGLGTHTIPIRFNNPPELSVITLAPA